MKKITIISMLIALISLAGIQNIFAQGAGCDDPDNILLLPYSEDGIETTSSSFTTDDITGAGAAAYDYTFTYTPLTDKTIKIELSNTTITGGLFLDMISVYVLDSCPTNPNATILDSVQAASNPVIEMTELEGLKTYYIVVGTGLSLMGDTTSLEFDIDITTVTPIDAGVTEIICSANSACGLSDSNAISLVIENFGTDTLINFDVKYTINGSGTQTETYTDSLYPGASDTVIMHHADFSTPNTAYAIEGFTDVNGDANSSNDATTLTIHNLPTTTVTAGVNYVEDFESGANNWFTGGTNSSWELAIPNDTTINDPGNHAWVTNATGIANAGENSYVKSPCFDLTAINNPIIQIDVWYETGQLLAGNGRLSASLDNGDTWFNINTTAWAGSAGDWQTIMYNADTLANAASVQFRITYATGLLGGEESGIAFDNFTIKEPASADLGIYSITPIESSCGLDSVQLSVVVANYGVENQANFDIAYTVNGVNPVSVTIADTIEAGDTMHYTFVDYIMTSTTGTYTIEAYTVLTGDQDADNDALSIDVVNMETLATFPYDEDFDTGNGGWAGSGTNSSWEWGQPTDSVINAASTTPNAWVTNLDGYHNSGEMSYLLSPCFDFTSLTDPAISFDIWYETQGAFMSGTVTIEATNDNGTTWTQVDTAASWMGSSAGWEAKSVSLSTYGGDASVQLRFAFTAGLLSQTSGVGIDNIGISECPTPTAGFTATENNGVVTTTNSSTGADSYSWTFGDGGTSTDTEPTHTYTQNGSYTITLIATNTCGNATATQTVDVCMDPVAGFSASVNNETVTCTNSSTNATSYSWDFGDGGTSTSVNPTHDYAASGTYTITLTASNDCGTVTDTHTETVSVTVGSSVEEIAGSMVKLYPNPAVNELTIDLGQINETEAMLTIVNIHGQVVLSTKVNTNELNKINVSNYANGVYNVKVQTENAVYSQKLIVK